MGSLIGGIMQSKAASKAADAQTAAANAQIEYMTESRDLIRDDLAPYLGMGTNALQAYAYNMGLIDEAPVFGGDPMQIVEFTDTVPGAYNANGGTWQSAGRDSQYIPMQAMDREVTKYRVGDQVFSDYEAAQDYAAANPTGGTEYGGFEASPGYEWRLGQGLDAIEGSAAARGGLYSGATMKALNQFGQDYGSAEFNNYQNQMLGLAGMGQSAAAMQANNEMNFANMYGQAQSSIGNAQAAGAIAQGNAWNNALNGMAGQWGYQNANGGSNNALGNFLFGGMF